MASIDKLSLLLFLSLLLCAAHSAAAQGESQRGERRVREARECRIQKLSASRPSRRIESEGGVTELWDELEDQFQCAGVAAMRNIIQPNSLSLPNFSPSPRLVYIEQGQGLLGISFPGCAETYHSQGKSGQAYRGGSARRRGQGDESIRDQHQKIQRIRQGDIVALPPGAAHWCYNDANKDLVALSVSDLNNEANQLDQRLRAFYLAGGQPNEESRGEQTREQGREPFGQNIVREFDANLFADALNIPVDLARRMQREDERGLIVRVQREGMSMILPEEEEEEEEEESYRDGGARNELEETYCTMSVRQNIDSSRKADVYSRQAGRLNSVNRYKLPILEYLDMSAEKGSLNPNAIHAPHWSMNAHSVFYVTRGEGRVQVVGNSGRTMCDERVKQGDLLVIPQYFASLKKAGNNGLEWVAFKTSGSPMKSPLVGSTSTLKGMPLQVLANAYRISTSEAQDLKYSRADHVMLFPPSSSKSATS